MVKGIKITVIVSLIASILMPFSFNKVHAETVSGNSPIIGVNINIIDYEFGKVPYQGTISFQADRFNCSRYTTLASGDVACITWQPETSGGVVNNQGTITYSATSEYSAYLYEYDFVFDRAYVGNILFSNTSPGATGVNRYYVNGSHLTLTSTTLITSFSISSYRLDALPDSVDQWYFPVESFTAISRFMNESFLQSGTYELIDYQVFQRWTFPLIKITVDDFDYQNATIYKYGTNAQDKIYFVFCTNMAHVSYFNQFFQITGGGSIVDQQTITRFNMPNPDTGTSQVWGIYRYTIAYTNGSAATSNVHIRTAASGKNPFFMIPIYFGYSQSTPLAISTDFALQFGLSNEFLDNLSIIANGTSQSSSQVGSNDNANSQFSSESENLIDFEDNMSDNMDSAMNDITPSPGISGFGGYFMNSAVWVRTQFENLTNNTPYASLITFGLTLGLALLLLGKVFL